MYTEKTIPQSLSALNERLHQKGTATRAALDGWIEKKGAFSISVTRPVMGRFSRTTRLSAQLTRQTGYTVIEATVAGGVEPRHRPLVFGAMALMAILMALAGSPLLAMLVIPAAVMLYIPMKGDYDNSALLISELNKTLKARGTPPKSASKTSSTAAKRSTTPSATRQAAPARQPALLASGNDDDDDVDDDDLDDEDEDDDL